jgi:hypothetical protein
VAPFQSLNKETPVQNRIWYDTEFLERGHRHGLELLSIGAVREDGGEYYAVVEDANWDAVRQHEWLMANVVPSLPGMWLDGQWYLDQAHPSVKTRATIAKELEVFLLSNGKPELWAWYGAYDHVALCQLWGRMIGLPKGVPMWTNDLRQEQHRLGDIPTPRQAAGQHNALMDARHNRAIHAALSDHIHRLQRHDAQNNGCRCYPE